MEKVIIYQIFTRLFGNKSAINVPNGGIEENGCAKFSHFTAKALGEIKKLGATHVWYTGVIEHATQTDYTAHGIARDHAGVVKGMAGSPYAIKDYYDIDPDLADDVEYRMAEFEALVARTHKAGLKVIIDFVPNHVARGYHSDVRPETDFGLNDRTDWHFSPQNNFYYCPNVGFAPQFDTHGYLEFPAKATGNDCFAPSPTQNDWYETVKLNYGVDYTGGGSKHFEPMPDTWLKMRDILLFWASKGIDGFRCDMAEMVPVEFWHWALAEVKRQYENLIFVAEVYNPAQYRSYIYDGGFDYLYDKVGLYDCLRAVSCDNWSAHAITNAWQQVQDIQSHMLNFLENHDEQRIASDFFAGDAAKGRPAMLVAACMNTNPLMVYFGQELGERGMDAEGFSGCDGRTTIFDYWRVDSICRWWNNGKPSLARLSSAEKQMRQFYANLLALCQNEPALSQGKFFDLMYVNDHLQRQYAFLRAHGDEVILCVANFSDWAETVLVNLPLHAFEYLQLQQQSVVTITDLISGETYQGCFNCNNPIRTHVGASNCALLKIKIA